MELHCEQCGRDVPFTTIPALGLAIAAHASGHWLTYDVRFTLKVENHLRPH